MNQRELATRFGLLSSSYVGQKRRKKDFTKWSQTRDPEGRGWRFDAEKNLFYPVID